MDHQNSEPVEYNPNRDYSQAMEWFKWGGAIFVIIALGLRFLIG